MIRRLIEIRKSQYEKLRIEGVFEEFRKMHGFRPYRKTTHKFYVVEAREIREALRKYKA